MRDYTVIVYKDRGHHDEYHIVAYTRLEALESVLHNIGKKVGGRVEFAHFIRKDSLFFKCVDIPDKYLGANYSVRNHPYWCFSFPTPERA